MNRVVRLILIGLVWIAALAMSPAFALDGRVTDTAGIALPGAQVCYMLGGAEQLCAETDEEGRYDLPKSSADRIRISRSGFLPLTIAAVPHGTDIQLRAAAVLRLWVEGVDGELPAESQAILIHPTGRQTGPFPVNANGLRVRGLEPGTYRVSVTVPGYRQQGASDVKLVPREESRVVVQVIKENGS